MIISKAKTHLARSGKDEKLKEGPTVPMPGPTLPKLVAVAPIADSKSSPTMVRIKVPMTKSNR